MPSAISTEMFHQTELDNYKLQVQLLHEKLQRSEEQRQQLEEKYEKIQKKRQEYEKSIKHRSRKRFELFLDEQQKRNERNKNIITMLELIDVQASALASKSERLKIIKLQYELYFAKLLQTQAMINLRNSPRYSIVPIDQMMMTSDSNNLLPSSCPSQPISTNNSLQQQQQQQMHTLNLMHQNTEVGRITDSDCIRIPRKQTLPDWNSNFMNNSNQIPNNTAATGRVYEANYLYHHNNANESIYRFPNPINSIQITTAQQISPALAPTLSMTTTLEKPIYIGGSIPIITLTTTPTTTTAPISQQKISSERNYSMFPSGTTDTINNNYDKYKNECNQNLMDTKSIDKVCEIDDGLDIKEFQQNCIFYNDNPNNSSTNQLQLNNLRFSNENLKYKENINKFDFGKAHYPKTTTTGMDAGNENVTTYNRNLYENHPISLNACDKLPSDEIKQQQQQQDDDNEAKWRHFSNEKLSTTRANDDTYVDKNNLYCSRDKADVKFTENTTIEKSQAMNTAVRSPDLSLKQQQLHLQREKLKFSPDSEMHDDNNENNALGNKPGNNLNEEEENQNRNSVMWNLNSVNNKGNLLSSPTPPPSIPNISTVMPSQQQFKNKEKISIENFENVVYGELIRPTSAVEELTDEIKYSHNDYENNEPIENQFQTDVKETNVEEITKPVDDNYDKNLVNDEINVNVFEPKSKIQLENQNIEYDQHTEADPLTQGSYTAQEQQQQEQQQYQYYDSTELNQNENNYENYNQTITAPVNEEFTDNTNPGDTNDPSTLDNQQYIDNSEYHQYQNEQNEYPQYENTDYQDYNNQPDMYDPNIYNYNTYDQQANTYQETTPQHQYPTTEQTYQSDIVLPSTDYQNYYNEDNQEHQQQQQLTSELIETQPVENSQYIEQSIEQSISELNLDEDLTTQQHEQKSSMKTNLVKPILSKDKSIDIENKKKKKVNFVDSNDESSLQMVKPSTEISYNDDSDFDFSSTSAT